MTSLARILQVIQSTHLANASALTQVSSVGAGVPSHGDSWILDDIFPKACYTNAFVTSAQLSCRYVLGYVLLPTGITIEHAWNVSEDGHHFDLTAGLHWPFDIDECCYFSLISFDYETAEELVCGGCGLDGASLRRNPSFDQLWVSLAVAEGRL